MISGIVLAAGTSERMGSANKLLLPLHGLPLAAYATRAALLSQVYEVLVVTGYQATQVEGALTGLPVRFVRNDGFADGLTSSIQAGVLATEPGAMGFLVFPADIPFVSSFGINDIIAAFRRVRPVNPKVIVRATWHKQPGHPVLFSSTYRDAILAHKGSDGCRDLVRRYRMHVCNIEVEGSNWDVDIASDLAAARENATPYRVRRAVTSPQKRE